MAIYERPDQQMADGAGLRARTHAATANNIRQINRPTAFAEWIRSHGND